MMDNTFDLEKSIAGWRKHMFAAGVKTPVPLEELESHLRDEIERQVRSGLNLQKAFEIATGKIGRADLLKNEFVKVGIPIHEQLKRLILTLACVPNLQLATNMNTTSSNIEPRWATYAKAGAFLFPALFLWLFTVAAILPAVNGICNSAGTPVFNNFESAPAWLKVWAAIGQAMIFLANHWFFIGSAIVLAVVSAERNFTQWPRYRRAAIGISALLLNVVVLLSLTMIIISMLIAVPALLHPGK